MGGTLLAVLIAMAVLWHQERRKGLSSVASASANAAPSQDSAEPDPQDEMDSVDPPSLQDQVNQLNSQLNANESFTDQLSAFNEDDDTDDGAEQSGGSNDQEPGDNDYGDDGTGVTEVETDGEDEV